MLLGPSATHGRMEPMNPASAHRRLRRADHRVHRRLHQLAKLYEKLKHRLGMRVRTVLPRRNSWTRRPLGPQWTTELLNVEGQWVRHHRRRATGTSQGTLLFVHGWGMAARSFEMLVEEFNDHDVVLVDLPGFAGLPHPSDPTMDTYGQTVASVCRALQLTNVTLVGHSTGCNVVVEAARRVQPSALVLISPPDTRQSLRRTIIGFARTSLHEPAKAKFWAVTNYLWAGIYWALEVLPTLLDYPIEEQLNTLDVPVLVIQGENDRVSTREWGRELQDGSGALVRVIPVGAHCLIIKGAHGVAEQMRRAIH